MNITKEQIKAKILSDQKWLERAILAIYDRQVTAEKADQNTKFTNMKGFNKPDAKKLSYYASWIKSGRSLSGWHLENARRKMVKYCGQLEKIAQGVL